MLFLFLAYFFGIYGTPFYNLKRNEHIPQLDFLKHTTFERGKVEMKKHKVIFAGITRDNALKISPVIKHIEHIGENYFKDYRVVLFENDSTDGTKFLLNLWQKNNKNVKVISKNFNNKKRPSLNFLSYARNQYLKEIRSKEYKDFDIVIILDMDFNNGIDVRGVADSFSKISEWDVVCSNGVRKCGIMRDLFAFKVDDIHKKDIYPVRSNLVPVHSCFGGMAIYKKKFLSNCYYGNTINGCEHVDLNQCITQENNGRIMLNPAQLLRYSSGGKACKKPHWWSSYSLNSIN